MRSALAALLLLVLASPALAQEERVRDVLGAEAATIIFGPQGGYAPRNYLKRYAQTDVGGAVTGSPWATQNGALAELIRRTPRGGKVRIAAFRCDEREVMDALFDAARQRNVEVKLWLKGPPGLTYMVDAHRQTAARANTYLRERAAAGKQAEWGEVQVMLGTAAQMAAFGKVNDMHEKFGVIDATNVHAPGRNHAFLGTSNIGSSSDRSHNESRLFFLGDAKATQALWTEFGRLWTHLGTGETWRDGDQTKGSNITPERDTRIRVGGGFADEAAGDALRFRFTYAKDADGQFHRVSEDFVAALRDSTSLPAGQVVWVAQFGFQIQRITDAILQAARQAPQVEYRVMVHMAEADAWDVRKLAEAKLPNLKVGAKWDSNKLALEAGSRPELPGEDRPGPALLHHKTVVIGDRTLITGSYNFFGDADAQGEGIVILRGDAPAYAHVLVDTRVELEALWRSGTIMDASKIHGPDGLLEQVETLSARDGFLETLGAVTDQPRSAEEVRAAIGAGAPTAVEVRRFLDALERFGFVTRDGQGRYLKQDPDVVAHAAKPAARDRALTSAPPAPPPPSPGPGPIGPVVVDPTPVDPPVDPTPGEATLRGRLVSGTTGGLRVVVPAGQPNAGRWTVAGDAAALGDLAALVNREVEVRGALVPADPGYGRIDRTRLVSPSRSLVSGRVSADGKTIRTTAGDTLKLSGPAAALAARGANRHVRLEGFALQGEVVVLVVEAEVNRTGTLTKNAWGTPAGVLERGTKVWASSVEGTRARVRAGDRSGFYLLTRLTIGVENAGLVDSLPPGQ